MIARLHRLDVTRLAADYSAAIRAELTDNQLAKVQAGDAIADDYTDPGECMAESIALQVPGFDSLADYAGVMADAHQRAEAAGFRLSRVLVGCEFSGTVRDAFRALGHDVMSCDLLPTESDGPHYQGDVRDIINDGWHMAVYHPPCTYLAACQLWRCQPKHDRNYPERQTKSDEALDFVRDLMAAPVDRWALENPRGRIGTAIRQADQEIHPYQFGHDVSKTTGLWLHNLPALEPDPADYVPPRETTYKGKPVKRWGNQSPCGADKTPPSKDRGHKRSKFFSGIARAMAEQWTGLKAAQAAPPQPAQLALF